MTPEILGHYRIVEKLSEGGWGKVYLARDERLDRDVALKVLSVGTLADEVDRKRFRKEALTAAKLSHSNIGQIYDFDTQAGVDFLVMEYVSGGTLARRIAGCALTEKEVAGLGMQVAQALEEAHEHGIIHRDLKPANIAITSNGQVKVLDFGLAKLFDPSRGALKAETLTQSLDDPHVVGTLPYMAPEQVRGDHMDARTDIYALGVVLYEMATRQRPFREDSTPKLFDSILHQPVVQPRALNPRVSPEMERIILKCLEKEPGERFQSAREIEVDLRRLTSGPTAVVGPRKHHLRLNISKLGAVLLIVAAIGAGYFISRLFWPQSAAAQRIMLAVLPFDNLSGDSNQEYFSDGLTDEMISQLGRWQPRRLGVIARTSAIHYKGSKERIDQIGHELGVAYILEGSVRRDGGRVRITAELIHVADQTPLWAETYERDSADVFAVQSEVASRITQSLALELLPSQHAPLLLSPTKDSAAHEAYLKGIYYLNSSGENYERAREYFEKAVQLDPKYAPAYASLAEYYWSTDKLPPQLAMPKAEQYALKSLELDGSLPEAHTALAGIRFFYNWDWPTAEKEFSRSLELNPSGAETHRLYALYLASLAGAEQAVREIRIAQQLDPFSLNINTTAGWVFNYTRQYDQAIEQCRKALEIDPDYVSAHDCLGDSYLAKGMFEQAAAEFRLAASGGEQLRAVGLARVYAVSGRHNEARSILDDLTKASKQSYFPPYLIGMIHVALGEKEQGLAWLEVAYTHRDPYLVHLKKDAAFDPLRSDPRFQDLLHRVGFPE